MKIHRFDEAASFRARAATFLDQHPHENNLLLGLVASMIEHEERFIEPLYLATVEDRDRVVGVALRTHRERPLLVSPLPVAAHAPLVANVIAACDRLAGVVGTRPTAQRFAETWSTVTGDTWKSRFEMRFYDLDRVKSAPAARGTLRPAGDDDFLVLCTWLQGFLREALDEGSDGGGDIELAVRRHLLDGAILIWEDVRPACMALCTPPTPHGVRIAGVYTPPDLRRRGYATACVAATSRRFLDAGHARCFLFTDLKNPTSNSIYQKIGYVHRCDFLDIVFEPGS